LSYAESTISKEFTEELFNSVHFKDEFTYFWVAESSDHSVVGCVAVKPVSTDEAELIRMAVDSTLRSQGIGQILVSELVRFCCALGFLRITCLTGNAKAALFYEHKCGFACVEKRIIPSSTRTMVVHRLVKYLHERLIKNVAIVGGTHGNELIGVELVRQWASTSKDAVTRPSFKTICLIGNPKAVEVNRRYVDEDLNRQFSGEVKFETQDNVIFEQVRAMELNQSIGPKGSMANVAADFVIDLHSTNSAMGSVAMISGASEDAFACRLVQHLKCTSFPDLKATNFPGTKASSYAVDSISPSGLSFEVGPLPHGTLRHEPLENTRQLVLQTLDFIEAHNQKVLKAVSQQTSDTDAKAELLHIRGRDIVSLSSSSTSDLVPTTFPTLEMFEFVVGVDYPRYPTLPSPSELSEAEGSAQTTCATSGLNYPTGAAAAVIHPLMESRNWEALEEGEPVFIAIDGSNTTTPFQYPTLPYNPFSGDSKPQLYPVFISEAAYYEKKIAFSLYKKISKPVY